MRTERPRKPIVLSGEEELELKAIAGSRSLPYGLVARAKTILMSAEDNANKTIAAKLGYSSPIGGPVAKAISGIRTLWPSRRTPPGAPPLDLR